MTGEYVGVLSEDEPLHTFLRDEVLHKRLGFSGISPRFDVYRLESSGTVFRYADRVTFVDLVGKYYGRKWIDGSQSGQRERRVELMNREYKNLECLRNLGMDAYPHRVVRPIAMSEELDCLLIEEFCSGADLDCYVRTAIETCRSSDLRSKLTDVAWFLADLHNRSSSDEPVDSGRGTRYLESLISHLAKWNIIDTGQEHHLESLRKRWEASGILNEGDLVLVHGDPIPPHFLFDGDHGVTAIDVERLWPGQRTADIGCVVAELKHLFYLYDHDMWASEPFIQHVYNTYSCYADSRKGESSMLTLQGRFYMGCYLLRISRNAWLELGYRQRLVQEAAACLEI